MTSNMFGYQINFGHKHHNKSRWKRARKRFLKRYLDECKKCGVWDSLCDISLQSDDVIKYGQTKG